MKPTEATRAISTFSYFKVAGRGISSSDAVVCLTYNNGRQHTYIDITLNAEDSDGLPVPVPDDVLQEVRLVDYETGNPLPDTYTIMRELVGDYARYDPYPNQPSQELESFASTNETTRIYVMVKTPSIESRRIAARLEYGGKIYHTHERSLPAGEGKTVAGRSNCSAYIQGVVVGAPLKMDSMSASNPVFLDNNDLLITYHQLRFAPHTNLRIVYATSRDVLMVNDYATHDIWYVGYFFEFTGPRQFKYDLHAHDASATIPIFGTLNTVYAVHIKHKDHSGGDPERGPITQPFHVFDQNGNEHEFYLRADDYVDLKYIDAF